MDDLISVIIPVYNVEKYIKKCLDSVINQSYQNLEIIIINDGSTDNSKIYIEEFLLLDKRIKYFEQKNKGLSDARNMGLKLVTGKYIMFIDSDDFLDINTILNMYNNLNENNSDICISRFCKYYSDETIVLCDSSSIKQKLFSNIECINKVLESKIQCFAWAKLFKKELLEKNDFQFDSGRLYEDFLPIFKIISKANCISILDEPLYYYRQRKGSITKNKNYKIIEDFFYAYSHIIKYLDKSSITVDKKSLNTFKVDNYSYFIKLYIGNYDGERIYNSFYNSEYKSMHVSLKKIILSRANIKNKLTCILWNFKFSYILKLAINIKNRIEYN